MTGRLARWRSAIRHRFGWNLGKPVSELRGREIWIGFECECGQIHHWHCAEVLP
jgi:hypothetical protein